MYKEIKIPAVLNPASIQNLLQQLIEVEMKNEQFVVLVGGDTLFCNGLDLAWVANSDNADHSKDMEQYALFLKKLQTGKFIAMAFIKGAVSGGGMGIVCACDYVIAEQESTFSLPEGLLGLIPGMILPSLLNRLTPQRVKSMVFTGKKYTALNALEFGIIDEISNNRQKAIEDNIKALRSCKSGAVADMKEILYSYSSNKDDLARSGMEILNKRLSEPEIKQRLKDISDFM
jgi:enoyl-CoA hydratase/carnithine racemase